MSFSSVQCQDGNYLLFIQSQKPSSEKDLCMYLKVNQWKKRKKNKAKLLSHDSWWAPKQCLDKAFHILCSSQELFAYLQAKSTKVYMVNTIMVPNLIQMKTRTLPKSCVLPNLYSMIRNHKIINIFILISLPISPVCTIKYPSKDLRSQSCEK